MAVLIDKNKLEEVNVPDEMVNDALLSGNFSFRKGETVNFVSPEGKTFNLPTEEALKAIKMFDYKYETSDQKNKRQLEKEYGGQNAQTALEALGSGLSFGAYDHFMKGFDPEYAERMQKRKEVNPFASAGGNIVSVVAPAMLSGGSSLLAKGAAKTAPGLISKVGLSTETAVSQLLKNAPSKGAVGFLAKKAPMTARALVEGGLIGAGQGVAEAANLDPDETAASVIAERTLDGVLGAGLGVGGLIGAELGAKAAVAAANPFIKASKAVLTPIVKNMTGGPVAGKTASEVLEGFADRKAVKAFGLKKKLADELDRMKISQEDLGKFINEEGLIQSGRTSIDDIANYTTEKLDDIRGQQENLYEAANSKINELFNKGIDDIAPVRADIFKNIESKYFEPMRNSDSLFEREAVERLEKQFAILKSSKDGSLGSDKVTLKKLWDTRKLVDEWAGYRKRDPGSAIGKEVVDVARKIRTDLNDEIFSVFDKLNKKAPEIKELGDIKEINSRMQKLIFLEKAAKDAIASNATNRNFSLTDHLFAIAGGAATGNVLWGLAIGAANNFVRKNGSAIISTAARKLAKNAMLENMNVRFNDTIKKSVSSFMKKVPATRNLGQAARQAIPVAYVQSKSIDDRFNKAVQNISQYNDESIAAAMANQESTQSEGDTSLWETNPLLMQKLTEKMMKDVKMIKAAVPKNPYVGDVFKEGKWKPTKEEMRTFLSVYDGVANPKKVIAEIAKGKIDYTAFKAMKESNPIYLQKIQQAIINEVGAMKDPTKIPYEKRLFLSFVSGAPLDKNMDGLMIAKLQQTYQQTGQNVPVGAEPQRVRPTSAKVRKSNLQNSTTQSQGLSKQLML